MRRLSSNCIGYLMLSLVALCSDIGVSDRGTGTRASITMSHTQPTTAEINVMLINTSTRDIRDQSWREDMIMNRYDRLAKSGAGGIIANTQAVWVPADRQRSCIHAKAKVRRVCIQTAQKRFRLLSISYPDARSPDFICVGHLSPISRRRVADYALLGRNFPGVHTPL